MAKTAKRSGGDAEYFQKKYLKELIKKYMRELGLEAGMILSCDVCQKNFDGYDLSILRGCDYCHRLIPFLKLKE